MEGTECSGRLYVSLRVLLTDLLNPSPPATLLFDGHAPSVIPLSWNRIFPSLFPPGSQIAV